MKKITFGLIVYISLISASFGAEIPKGFKIYTIKPDDTLTKFVPKEAWDMTMRINGVDHTSLQIGDEILIPIDPKNIPVFCPVPTVMPKATEKREIFVFLDSQYFGAYEDGTLVHWGPISSGGVGRETPKGKHRIVSKHTHYVSKKYGSPMPYAQCFDQQGGRFFHQQSMPGKAASHSCIRLLMMDAKWLFGWTRLGDKVTIK